MKEMSVSGVLNTADLKPAGMLPPYFPWTLSINWQSCCLFSSLPRKTFLGGRTLHYELFSEAAPQPLLGLDGVRLVGVSGEDEVLLVHHLVQDLQADRSKCMRQVCEGMKEGCSHLG